MIVTLTLNPAVDKSTEIESLVAEKKMRCAAMQLDAGGGGINISKAIQKLGGQSIAVFTCGGINGKVLTQLLDKESITGQAIEIREETRESFVVNELQSNKQFRFVMPGPSLSEEELEKIKETVAALDKASFLICSGSLPPNVPAGFLGELADIANNRGIRFIVDTSGPPLKAAMEKGVYLLKPNLTELCSLVGKPHLDMLEIEDAAMQVVQSRQCEIMVVSMGPSGAMLVTKNEIRQFRAPTVKKQTTVGAGDSMVAGIVWMIDHGKPLADAVRFGIACGSAATINKGTQLFKKEDALRFYDWIVKNG